MKHNDGPQRLDEITLLKPIYSRVIIALQALTNALLWTRYPDFTPWAAALAIPLYQPPVVMVNR